MTKLLFCYCKIQDVLGHEDSKKWLDEEVCGMLVQASGLFVLFDKMFIKVLFTTFQIIIMFTMTKYLYFNNYIVVLI